VSSSAAPQRDTAAAAPAPARTPVTAPASASASASAAAAASASASAAAPLVFEVSVPAGVAAGSVLRCRTPQGHPVDV